MVLTDIEIEKDIDYQTQIDFGLVENRHQMNSNSLSRGSIQEVLSLSDSEIDEVADHCEHYSVG